MRAWWQSNWALFQPKTCQSWIDMALEIPPRRGVVGHGGEAREDAMRVSLIRWIPKTERWLPVIARLIELIHEANDYAFGFDLTHMPDIQFTEYRAEQEGHYAWHEDLSWTAPREFHRKLSIVVQLSDPASYDGGDLELKHDQPEQALLRQRGTVIVFPSFMEHRVTPVTRGVRHSLVAWMHGPKFR